MLSDIDQLRSELTHIIFVLEYHRNQKVGQSRDQVLHVFAPIFLVLNDRFGQHFVVWFQFSTVGHKQRVNLESVSNLVTDALLDDVVN
jgi:hypothetical protein